MRGLESAITISKGNGLGKPQPQPELAEGAEPQPPLSQPLTPRGYEIESDAAQPEPAAAGRLGALRSGGYA